MLMSNYKDFVALKRNSIDSGTDQSAVIDILE